MVQILELFFIFLLVSDDSIVTLSLPDDPFGSKDLVDSTRTTSLDPFQDVCKIVPTTGLPFPRLKEEVNVIRHDNPKMQIVAFSVVKEDMDDHLFLRD
jgi:hypothetical protein